MQFNSGKGTLLFLLEIVQIHFQAQIRIDIFLNIHVKSLLLSNRFCNEEAGSFSLSKVGAILGKLRFPFNQEKKVPPGGSECGVIMRKCWLQILFVSWVGTAWCIHLKLLWSYTWSEVRSNVHCICSKVPIPEWLHSLYSDFDLMSLRGNWPEDFYSSLKFHFFSGKRTMFEEVTLASLRFGFYYFVWSINVLF